MRGNLKDRPRFLLFFAVDRSKQWKPWSPRIFAGFGWSCVPEFFLWGGGGKPKWVKELEAKGGSLDDFKIQK